MSEAELMRLLQIIKGTETIMNMRRDPSKLLQNQGSNQKQPSRMRRSTSETSLMVMLQISGYRNCENIGGECYNATAQISRLKVCDACDIHISSAVTEKLY